jgi:CubicO group peptidase (beta-lactamase class C family)
MGLINVKSGVVKALERAIELGEVGVAVAAYVGDELIVDEWIGLTAEHGGAPVEADTLFPIFSVTKAMIATALHLQAERGLVEYDEPIATYWPEFAQGGKGRITVRQVLCHQSGVVAMPPDLTPALMGDWEWITTRLAEMEPLHLPGEVNTYHALTFGWLIGEVVRRTDPQRRFPCQFVCDEILTPFEIDNFFLPLPAEQDHRVAELTSTGAAQADYANRSLRDATVPPRVAPVPEIFNCVEMRRACNPSAGAISTARDVARFFAILANGGMLDGKRILSEQRVRSCLTVRPDNDRIDELSGSPTSVGIGGFWVRDPSSAAGSGVARERILGSGSSLLFQSGAGGSIAFADLDTRASVAICHNRMFGAFPLEEHPWVEVADAVWKAVGAAF